MTRVLIPRSDNTSAKIVEASDFEKYHSFLNDHIISGFVVSAGSGLDVDVGTGTGRLQGLYVENTVTCNVSGLTACSTNYLYISIDRDPNCEPEGWSFVTNTTNTTPACSIKIASIVTGAATVSSVSQVQDSGDGSGDITYNSGVNNEFFYGTGACGDVTISTCTVLVGPKYYQNLTINCGVTVTSCTNPLFIYVSCTATINGTIHMDGVGMCGGTGGAGGNGG